MHQCKRMKFMQVFIFPVLLFLFVQVVRAEESDSMATALLNNLLTAVEKNDYNAFVKNGTDKVKATMTKQMLSGVSGQLSPRMKKGYTKTYLGSLKQQGCHVHLWKLTFNDKGDDILAKLALKENKVAGFWFQ